MKRTWILALSAALLLTALPALGQGREGAGTTNMGRGRTTWLTDAELATEEQKAFIANLDRMPLAEWKETSVAWLVIEVDKDDRRIHLPETYHVGEVTPNKRAEVERGGAEWEPAFEIAFPKKPPTELEVTLTDVNSTKVTCRLGDAVKGEQGMLGVFVHEATLLCVFRPAGEEGEELAPA